MYYKTKTIAVRYGETDQMGFVHYSNYLKYFESSIKLYQIFKNILMLYND